MAQAPAQYQLWNQGKAVVGGSGGNQQNGAFYGVNPNAGKTGSITSGVSTTKPAATTKPTTTQQKTSSASTVAPASDPMQDAIRAQQEAAAREAEARRVAARNKYQGAATAAGVAKDAAKGQYDWLINTLGTNKQDALNSVALNEKQALEGYDLQQTKTKQEYDRARGEIVTTYRDLNREQEKLLRGSGQAQSSRSLEAQLRLNNLLAKDLSTVSTNEADSIAMIGNAITAFKEKSALAKNQIESESKSKLDKAALDYDTQIKAIDANLQLSENERESAYAEAESILASRTAEIQTWAAGLKLQQQQAERSMKGSLDNLITYLGDSNQGLNAQLGEKAAKTNEYIQSIGFNTQLNTENVQDPSYGVYRSPQAKIYNSFEEIQQAFQSGQISQSEANQFMQSLQQPSSTQYIDSVPKSMQQNKTLAQNTSVAGRVSQDPMLSAIFG